MKSLHELYGVAPGQWGKLVIQMGVTETLFSKWYRGHDLRCRLAPHKVPSQSNLLPSHAWEPTLMRTTHAIVPCEPGCSYLDLRIIHRTRPLTTTYQQDTDRPAPSTRPPARPLVRLGSRGPLNKGNQAAKQALRFGSGDLVPFFAFPLPPFLFSFSASSHCTSAKGTQTI